MTFCSACGSRQAGTHPFCSACGTPLASAATTAELPPTAPIGEARPEVPIWVGHEPASAGGPPDSSRILIIAVIALVVLAGAGLGGWVAFRDPGSKDTTAPTRSTAASDSAAGNPAATPGAGPGASEPGAEPTDPDPATNLATEASVEAPRPTRNSEDSDGAVSTYAAANLVDDDPETCWRMSGNGSGQSIDLLLNASATITSVGLINGYAKVDAGDGTDRYLQERRILKVTWTFGDGTSLKQTLKDYTSTTQTIELPTPVSTDSVTLTIDSTTSAGDADHDQTAISEIEIFGR
jgi:hypothetical protein